MRGLAAALSFWWAQRFAVGGQGSGFEPGLIRLDAQESQKALRMGFCLTENCSKSGKQRFFFPQVIVSHSAMKFF